MTAPRYAILCGDVATILAQFPDGYFHGVLTDPPYFLSFMGKDWDTAAETISVSEQNFRAWFAGLVAGEGYFRIQAIRSGHDYQCSFGIHMRADETPLLAALHKKLGIGTISHEGAHTNKQGVSSAPSVRWVVQSKKECRKIASILRGFPLYAKKQREFDLWCQALTEWEQHKHAASWEPLRLLYEEMKLLRPFDEDLAQSKFDPFGGTAYSEHYRWAKEVFRVSSPGAHLLAFGGTRTSHRLTCAIEDGGFEIRDSLCWLYGSGFPKSLNVSKALDKKAGATREVVGYQTLGGNAALTTKEKGGTYASNTQSKGTTVEVPITRAATEQAKQWEGYGTNLKPAHEPITLARKPLDGTIVENVTKHGAGPLNVDESRIGDTKRVPGSPKKAGASAHTVSLPGFDGGSGHDPNVGRWPANVILDEEAAALLDASTKATKSQPYPANDATGDVLPFNHRTAGGYSDSGGVSRFFYCPKVSKKERGEGNNHSTLKPQALTEYLARLILPPPSDKPRILLVPFAGTGSEMIGALRAGWDLVIGIEQQSDYVAIAEKRIEKAIAA